MPAFRFVLSRFLAPRHLLVIAGLCAAVGVVLAYAAVHDAAERKLALRQGPPPAVAVEDYRSMVHRGPAGEVVLRAHVDLEAAFVFTLPGSETRALLVPLFPVGDAAAREAQGVLFLPDTGAGLPDAATLVRSDPSGWVELNGVEADAGPFRLMLAGALAAEGRALAARVTVVSPFPGGRAAALRPPARPPLGWALFLSAALGFLAAGLVLEARRPAPAARRASGQARTPVASGRFAPLPPEEDDIPAEGASTSSAARALVRAGTAGLLGLARALRTGLCEIRSSR